MNKILISFFMISLILVSFVSSSELALIEISDVSPTSLMPGEETKITFELENVGGDDLENIIFSWEDETGTILPIGTSNTKVLEELDEGDDDTITFTIFTSASADPGLYKLELTLEFELDEETITQTSSVGIIVGGETEFDLAVSDISDEEVLLSIANIGQNDANSVTVSIPNQENFEVTGTSSSILGNIEKDDYSIVSFQLVSTSSSNTLDVEISYTDTMGIRQTITEQVQVELTSSSSLTSGLSSGETTFTPGNFNENSSSNSNLMLYGLAGISLFAMVFIGITIKKTRKKSHTKD